MAIIYNKLNNYWLWREISRKLNVSNPAYTYWKESTNLKLNNKYVFLQKDTLPAKYDYIQESLTDLGGYLPTKFASDKLHVNDHLFSYDKMKLHSSFEYKYVENIKFVNIRRFFREHGIAVKKDSLFHLGKINDLEITEESTFYKIKDNYGIVVYD
ncbi:MAG: hypothetical protein GQ570_14475 [Helicobacteraceae bacterium]|nr:hypothetical protein [Helicobacteraceae bacterium]